MNIFISVFASFVKIIRRLREIILILFCIVKLSKELRSLNKKNQSQS